MTGIDGMTALVTGGGSGIGLGTAKRFAADGAHVTICGRTEAKLDNAVGEIRGVAAAGAAVDYIVADVTVEAQVEAAVTAATKPTGRLDILFANAGGTYGISSIADADSDGVRGTIELNLFGTYLCVKHAARVMKPQGSGSIITMSSGAGHFPHRFLWAYGMSKAGIEMFTRYAAEELGDFGVRVNCVQPGIIDDELMAFITAGGKLLDDYLDQMPIRRLGTVDDVAAAVRFLAGPESTWVTGECFAIDGGHHLRRGANYSLLFEE